MLTRRCEINLWAVLATCRALIAAIMKRNDEAFLAADDEMMDEHTTAGEKLEDPEKW